MKDEAEDKLDDAKDYVKAKTYQAKEKLSDMKDQAEVKAY